MGLKNVLGATLEAQIGLALSRAFPEQSCQGTPRVCQQSGGGQTIKVFSCMDFHPNVPLLEDGTPDRMGCKVVVRNRGR